MYTIAVYFQYEMYKVYSIRKVSKSYRITNIIIDLCLWIDIIGRGGGRMKSPWSPVSLMSEPVRS